MNRCPISYEPCGEALYSEKGLKRLSQHLSRLERLSYTAEEQRNEAMMRASKMSVQGVQPKLSAVLNIKNSRFDIVNTGGRFIMKPQHQFFPQLPENEDVTMRMAKAAGLNVPLHGLIWSQDKSLSYFIKRFDRTGHQKKIPVEDFSQLAGLSRETKYNYSMEKLLLIIDEFCTFPVVEKSKLFRIVVFNYLTGNEDMHMKNYSLISKGIKTELSPAYDLLNTTIVLKGKTEEIALPVAGKKSNLNKEVLIDYFGVERCGLTAKVIETNLFALSQAKQTWFSLLEDCFLSDDLKEKYRTLLQNRLMVMGL